MRIMRSMLVCTVASAVLGMSLSAAMAKEVATKTGTESKAAKSESVKTGIAPKVVKDNTEKIRAASRVVKEITAIPKRKIPPVLVNGASAVVIVPKAAKHDFMVSGGSAAGVLLVRDKEGKWSSPVFITLSGGSLGWQIVGDPMDIVLVIKHKKSVDAILKGKFTMDAKVAIEPGHLGLTMKGATTKEQKADIASYLRGHGAFDEEGSVAGQEMYRTAAAGSQRHKAFEEEASVAGASLQIDAAANDVFYANPKVDAGDIASGKVAKSTEEVTFLQKLLTDYGVAK